MQRLASWASRKFILGTNSLMKDRKTGIQAVASAHRRRRRRRGRGRRGQRQAETGSPTSVRSGLPDGGSAGRPTNPETRLQRAIGLLQAMDITLLEEGLWAIEVIKQAAPETLASLLR